MGKLNYFYYPDGTGKWVEGGDTVPEGMARSKPEPLDEDDTLEIMEAEDTSVSDVVTANESPINEDDTITIGDDEFIAAETHNKEEISGTRLMPVPKKKRRGRQPSNN